MLVTTLRPGMTFSLASPHTPRVYTVLSKRDVEDKHVKSVEVMMLLMSDGSSKIVKWTLKHNSRVFNDEGGADAAVLWMPWH